MNAELHSYMKVGIVSFMAYPTPPLLAGITQLARDPFFTAIEVTHIPSPEDRAAAAQLLATSGLEVGYGAQPVQLGGKLDLNSLDEATRRAAVDRIRACVDEAVGLGCGRLAVLSGPDPAPERREEAKAALVSSLDELCGYAEQRGLGITLEVFDQTIDKKALIGPTVDGVAVAEQLRAKHPSFGLMLDLSHLPMQFESADEALQAAAGCLVHVHIGNCVLEKGHPAYGDTHPRFGLPGGSNDVAELRAFLKVLADIGYIGPGLQRTVAFEVKPLPGESPEVVVANAKRTLLQAWAAL
jgi:sugar phosphate isomerase/epimerase